MNQQVEEQIVELVQNDPQQAEFLATFWTVAMLALALAKKIGVTLSPSSVRLALQRLGLRWGRPHLAMPAQAAPEEAGKQCAAEPRLQLLPLIRAMWHRVGEQIRIPTPGTNVTRVLFGALEIRTGQWIYLRPTRGSQWYVGEGTLAGVHPKCQIAGMPRQDVVVPQVSSTPGGREASEVDRPEKECRNAAESRMAPASLRARRLWSTGRHIARRAIAVPASGS